MTKQLALALALVVLLGCSKDRSDREVDCAKVSEIVDQAIAGVPRRYRDEALRERARDRLKQVDYSDAAVRQAALDPQLTYERIEQLCTRGTPIGTGRERDCAWVRGRLQQVPFDIVPDRARSGGIRDEAAFAEFERRVYEDPAVKQAAIDMVRATGAAFFTPNDRGDAATIDTRARAAYDKLANLCGLRPLK